MRVSSSFALSTGLSPENRGIVRLAQAQERKERNAAACYSSDVKDPLPAESVADIGSGHGTDCWSETVCECDQSGHATSLVFDDQFTNA